MVCMKCCFSIGLGPLGCYFPVSECGDGGIGFEFMAVEWWAIVRFEGNWHVKFSEYLLQTGYD